MKLKTIIFIVFLLFLVNSIIFKYFYYYNKQNNCSIKISPSFEFSGGTIIRAIAVLKNSSFDDYQDLCQNVNTISTRIACGGFGGGCFYQNSPNSITVSASGRDLTYAVSIIVHETCHAIQFSENRDISEPECYAAGRRILKEIIQF